MCKQLGVAWYHPYFSRRSAAGWPDLALCGDNGFLLRELKTGGGRLTRDQQDWGLRLRAARMSWDVWRPGRPSVRPDTRRTTHHPLTTENGQ